MNSETTEQLRWAVKTSEGRGLDDLTRARIKRRLMRQLDRRAGAPRSRPRVVVITGALAAAALALAALGWIIRGAVLTAPEPAARLDLLVVRAVRGTTAGVPGPGRRLDVPRGAVVRADVGRAAVITALGQTRVAVTRAEPHEVQLRLQRGTLALQVYPSVRRQFVVYTPAGRVSVVGTNFVVRLLAPDRLLVAVERGVVVRPGIGEALVLQAGQAWRSGETRPRPIPAQLRRLLVAHRSGGLDLLGQIQTLDAAAPWSGAPASSKKRSPAASPTAPPAGMDRRPQHRAGVGQALTARQLYVRAERQLGRGQQRRAQRTLGQLLRRFSSSPLAGMARYELARLALERGQWSTARRHLRPLLDGRDRSLRDPAHFMLCRVALQQADVRRAITCLQRFRRRFPRSPHDQRAQQLLRRAAGARR